jgi:hypothetical protein
MAQLIESVSETDVKALRSFNLSCSFHFSSPRLSPSSPFDFLEVAFPASSERFQASRASALPFVWLCTYSLNLDSLGRIGFPVSHFIAINFTCEKAVCLHGQIWSSLCVVPLKGLQLRNHQALSATCILWPVSTWNASTARTKLQSINHQRTKISKPNWRNRSLSREKVRETKSALLVRKPVQLSDQP